MRASPLLVPTLLTLTLAACGDAPAGITAPDAEPAKAALVPVCVDFSVPALGATAGGTAGNLPGDLWFTESLIPVTLRTFHHPPGFGTTFGDATVLGAFVTFGSGQIVNTNNINLGFDFSGIGFVPSSVTFQWRDYGGYENLRVNGSGIYVGELTGAPSPIGGATVSHVWGWSPGNNYKQGTTTLTGPVSILGIGGQEFYLDNVCANP
ncbi:hypothetical protein [Longimicrobium sp.]|uniref:hypothetical protein n=1 Tax=Longimicrobium sp. TaxID=2029185 RepID=UPI002E36E93F|nr:hypothetical protein [Longimicrobium sp.]HEX6039886.1 hypothetical protein [Longimicrobium sp.]